MKRDWMIQVNLQPQPKTLGRAIDQVFGEILGEPIRVTHSGGIHPEDSRIYGATIRGAIQPFWPECPDLKLVNMPEHGIVVMSLDDTLLETLLYDAGLDASSERIR